MTGLYGKLVINCTLTVQTGMHIGGSSAFSAIGAVDSVVVRDAMTGWPMLPGSSLKGKMRTLLARAIKNHYILDKLDNDPAEIIRLFGKAGNSSRNENPKGARLQFADAFITNADRFKDGSMTEVKFENTIDRLSSVANPRQIERVVRGAEFGLRLVYDLEEPAEVEEDFANIARALKLVAMDYLGGHGSRGYGRVSFSRFTLEVREGECPADTDKLLNLLKEVEEYGIFAVQA